MSLKNDIIILKKQGLGAIEISKRLNINVSSVYYHTNPKIRRRIINRALNLKKDNKRQIMNTFGGKCLKCEYSLCPEALVLHHRNPMEKDIRISGTCHSPLRLAKELKKTVMLCCRCHTELHAGYWSCEDLKKHGLVYHQNGQNTGRLILPPSKRSRSISNH